MGKHHHQQNITYQISTSAGGGGPVVSPPYGGNRINTLADNLRQFYAATSPMNEAAVMPQNPQQLQQQQQQQQHHHTVANGRENRGHGGGNNCNNNNIQSSPILTSMNTLNKDMDGGQSTMLGHKIWDKSIRFDTYDDVKLEYMDLEEFLIENELPIDSVFDEQQNIDEENRRRSALQPQQASQSQMIQDDQFNKRLSLESEAQQPQLQSTEHLVNSSDHQMHQQHTSNDPQHNNTNHSHSQQLQHPHLPPPHHSSNLMVNNLHQVPSSGRESNVPTSAPRPIVNSTLSAQNLISSSSMNVQTTGSSLRVPTTNGTASSGENLPPIPVKAESQDVVSRMQLENATSSFTSRLDSGLYDESSLGADKLALSRTVCSPDGMSPGESKLEDDMHRYSFGDDDIKPPRDMLDNSPLSPSGKSGKKRDLSMSAEDSKDDRYWERRRKNNMAAKRSRDARRVKENQIAMKATFYERENKILTQELGKARAEIHLLRERLCKYEIV